MSSLDSASPRAVLVAGAINTDLVARVEKAPDAGETVTGSSFAIFGGGKGANQAIATARSGAPTAMLGALGDDDFGRARRADLDVEGIDTGSVARSETASSGVALIVVEERSGQNRISYVPGATLTIRPAQARHAVNRVQPSVVLTTLEPTSDTIDALIEAAHAIGATIVLNASPEAIGARPFLDRLPPGQARVSAADRCGQRAGDDAGVSGSEGICATSELGGEGAGECVTGSGGVDDFHRRSRN